MSSKMACSATIPLAKQLTVIKPIENSVEEVKVLTGTLPAEYGHSASGVITTVKKSGTNELARLGLRLRPDPHA